MNIAIEEDGILHIYNANTGKIFIRCRPGRVNKDRYMVAIHNNNSEFGDVVGNRSGIDVLMQIYALMLLNNNTVGAAIVSEYVHILEGQE